MQRRGETDAAPQVKWTKAYRKSRGKELAMDSTFDFERRRNRPVRYNRDLVAKTLHAIDRVSEIREARELDHYQQRMAAPRRKEDEDALKELEREGDRLLGADARREQAEKGMADARRERRAKRAAKAAAVAEARMQE